MKKGLLIIFVLAVASVLGITATYDDIRIDGSSGWGYVHYIDTSDTGTDGMAYYCDTMLSDTFSIDSTYKYVNIDMRFHSVDTGSYCDGDTVMDTFEVRAITYSHLGGSRWTVFVDTFVATGDSARHHFFVDTLVYDKIYFQTIYWDSVDVTYNDTNSYNFNIDIWAGGTR